MRLRRGGRCAACLLVLVCVAAPAAGCGGTGDGGPASDPFAYDRGASLGVRELGSWRDAGVTVHDVRYASPRGGSVPAFVVVPDGDGPFAGLIVQHGMPSSRRDTLPIALEFTRLGAVAAKQAIITFGGIEGKLYPYECPDCGYWDLTHLQQIAA